MKNLKRKSSILALILMLSLAIAAQPNGNGNGQNKGEQRGKKGNYGQCINTQEKGERMAQYLELTDEQQTKIESLKLDHQKKMLPLKNELGEKKAKMKTLSTANPADMKAINSLIDEMGTIKTKMQKDRAAMHQEIRKVLTEEQRLKFDMHAGQRGHEGRRGHGNCGR